jgi:hypothetical protein
MKLTCALIVVCVLAGCSGNGGNGGTIPHADSEGSTPRNEGAPLCHDGTPPPCTIRN